MLTPLAALLLAAAPAPADTLTQPAVHTVPPHTVPASLWEHHAGAASLAHADRGAFAHTVPAPAALRIARERSPRRAATIGAVAGAVAGTGVLLAVSGDGCGETGSMCGLGIPVFVGGGTVLGGVVGWAVGALDR